MGACVIIGSLDTQGMWIRLNKYMLQGAPSGEQMGARQGLHSAAICHGPFVDGAMPSGNRRNLCDVWEDAGWLHSVHHRRFIIPSGFLHGRYSGVTLPRRAVRIRTGERVFRAAAKFV